MPVIPLPDQEFRVGLLLPFQGPVGMVGPAGELSAQLSMEAINASGGVLGREMTLTPIDAGRHPEVVAAEVARLVENGDVHAVVGTHPSSVRRSVVNRIAGRVPYIYTSVYEGGEQTPGVFLTGETPATQLLPAMAFLEQECGNRRWLIVGNDYIWPRVTAAKVHGFAQKLRSTVVDEAFVPFGTTHFEDVLDRIERSDADSVLVLLVCHDAVEFHRAFARRGLHDKCLRLSPLIDENMLAGLEESATADLYASAGYFESIPTPERIDFADRYLARFGDDAPVLGNLSESVYEGMHLLDALVHTARSTNSGALNSVADRVQYSGARGHLGLARRHVRQPVYLARAEGVGFTVLRELTAQR